MSEHRFHIHNLIFDDDSLVIGYIELPTDVRVQGQVILQRQLRLALTHPDYADDAMLLQDRITKVLKNALDDFGSSEPYEPSEAEDDDSELGMGE